MRERRVLGAKPRPPPSLVEPSFLSHPQAERSSEPSRGLGEHGSQSATSTYLNASTSTCGSDREPQLSLIIESQRGVPTFTRIEFNSGRVGRPVIGQHLAIARRHLSYRLDTIVELVASAEPPDPFQSPRWADSEAAHSAVRDAKRRRHPTTTGRRRRVITPECLRALPTRIDETLTAIRLNRSAALIRSPTARPLGGCRCADPPNIDCYRRAMVKER
jgi:hypothetical protein